MRIKIKQIIAMIALFAGIAFGYSAKAQIPDEIILSLKSGNAKTLAKHFSSNVELTVLDREDVYSKAQAEQLVRNFFEKYSPDKFFLIHQGTQEGRPYAIGNLQSGRNTFRVSFLLRKGEGDYKIHMLRIEKVDE
ncbi:MAG: DUF4783 domain-containing protein [Bacteroidota bacterium]|nr:DUF4783 domain-containing protein [Bacteroidota bacterium]MDP4206834.1 DUF4783 domain-containing protein [Bacteroidota bacterium]